MNMEPQLNPQTELHQLLNFIESPDIRPEDVRIFEDDPMDLEISVKVERDADARLCTMCHTALRAVNFIGKDVVDGCITQTTTSRENNTIEEVNSPILCFDCFTQTQLGSLTDNTDALCDQEQSWNSGEPYDNHDIYEYKHQVVEKISDKQYPPLELTNKFKVEEYDIINAKIGRVSLICDACKGIFFTKSDLISHVEEFDVNPENSKGGYKITNCTVSRRPKPVLSKASEQRKEKHECKVCHKSYLKKYNLVKHEKRTHVANNCTVSQRPKPVFLKASEQSKEKKYKCKVCHKSYLKKYNLVKHEKRKHVARKNTVSQRPKSVLSKSSEQSKENKYKCKVCHKSYLNKYSLIKHEKRKHIAKNGFKCKVCHKKLSHESSLTRHMLTHTGEKPFKCKVCYKRFAYSHCVTEHMREVHPGQKPYQCDMCPEAFREKRLLNSHVRIHLFGETNSKLQNIDNVDYARKEQNFDLKELYLCDFCKGVFFSKSRLIRHIQTFKTFPHNVKIIKSCDDCVVPLCTDYMCSECPKEFALKEFGRKMDVRYKYHCDKCPISFMNRASYYAHVCSQELSPGEAPKLYQCKVCYKRLAESHTLKRHMRTHTGQKMYQCKCCLMKFAYSQTLYQHMKIRHPHEKPFECEFCPERFTRFKILLHHMKYSHKNRQCKVCHKIIITAYLKEHMQRHNGIKPYKCKICLQRFVASNVLTRHMRTHTGEKPYQCKVCLKRLSNNLPAHMKMCHAEMC